MKVQEDRGISPGLPAKDGSSEMRRIKNQRNDSDRHGSLAHRVILSKGYVQVLQSKE